MSPIQFPDFPPDLERVVVDGVELHHRILGSRDAPPVVLVHGGGDDLRYWEAQIDPLAERYRVVTYSRRHSAPNDNPIRATDHSALVEARDLERFLDALGLDATHLIAHSYGALTSLLFSIRHPDRVRTLTLCEPPVVPWASRVPNGEAVASEFLERVWKPAGAAFQRKDPNAIGTLLDGIIGDGFFAGLPEELRRRILGNARDMEALCISSAPFPDVPMDLVERFDRPTLLLTGELTTPINTIGIQVLDRVLPDRELRVIPQASHEVFVENPAASTAAVLAFLAKHDDRAIDARAERMV